MRRKWYLGFGILLIAFVAAVIALLLLVHADPWWVYGWLILVFGSLGLIAIYDLLQRKHTILRNFPILGHMRYILEFFRPEIQQYFVATDTSERPYNRQQRSLIYSRAKKAEDTLAFGTEHDINTVGYEWGLHSLAAKPHKEVEDRITVGNHLCKQPYSASHLNASAMSFGALSKNAVMAINKGAKMGNFYQNTGEGGLTEYHLQGGDVVLQIGTGYFGFRTHDGNFDPEKFKQKASHESVKMIEIKMSQGAKPSHGGVLPKEKLSKEIAAIRDVPLGEDVISPPTHKAFSTPEELCHFLTKLRELTDGKPVGFKLAIGRKTEFLAICKAMLKTEVYPDFITVDGAEGGTGAAPAEFTNYLGLPLEDALAFVHNALVGCNIRQYIRIIASGKHVTGFDMVKRMAIGADMINVARPMMMAVGCIQSRTCNTNTCPVGVATQKKRLIRALNVEDKKTRVYHFHDKTIKSFLEIVGGMGFNSPLDIKASRIMRRTGTNTVASLESIYHYATPGSLLDHNDQSIPDQLAPFWRNAQSNSFEDRT